MTDYLNSSVPVSNPDENGNHKIVAVRAGQLSSFTKPINMCGGYLVNQLGDVHIQYESVVTSDMVPSAANYVPVVPNVAGNLLRVLSIGVDTKTDQFIANGANIGTFRVRNGTNPLRVYAECVVQSLGSVGDTDNFRLGLFQGADAGTAFAGGATPLAVSGDLAVNASTVPSNALVTRTWRIQTGATTAGNSYCLVVLNRTENTRAFIVRYFKIIVNS